MVRIVVTLGDPSSRGGGLSICTSRVWQEGHTVQFTNQPALFLSLEGLQLCPLQQWPGGTSRNPSDLTLGQMKLLSSGSLG